MADQSLDSPQKLSGTALLQQVQKNRQRLAEVLNRNAEMVSRLRRTTLQRPSVVAQQEPSVVKSPEIASYPQFPSSGGSFSGQRTPIYVPDEIEPKSTLFLSAGLVQQPMETSQAIIETEPTLPYPPAATDVEQQIASVPVQSIIDNLTNATQKGRQIAGQMDIDRSMGQNVASSRKGKRAVSFGLSALDSGQGTPLELAPAESTPKQKRQSRRGTDTTTVVASSSLAPARTPKKSHLQHLDERDTLIASTIVLNRGDFPYSSVERAKPLPYRHNLDRQALNNALIALISQRPRIALRGVHVVVHDVYSTFDTYGKSELAYQNLSKSYLYPSQWESPMMPSSSDTVAKLVRGDVVNRVGFWYNQFAPLVASSDANGDVFQKRCFTIDIDPTSYATEQNKFSSLVSSPYGLETAVKMLQYNIDKAAFGSFLKMMSTSFTRPNGDKMYNLIDEMMSSTDWKYAEQSSRRYSIFMKRWKDVVADATAIENLIDHPAFKAAVTWFLRNEWKNYDSIFGVLDKVQLGDELRPMSHRKQFFVEVIGFATAEEWQQSQHDFTLTSSRKRAWDRWVERVQELSPIRPRMKVFGVFAWQLIPLPPFATAVPPRHWHWDVYDKDATTDQSFLGAMVPIQFSTGDRFVNSSGSYYYMHDEAMSLLDGSTISQSSIGAYLRFVQNTGYDMPKFLVDNSLNPYLYDLPFRRDEFNWSVPVKKLGEGGYGQVIKIRFQESHKSNQGAYYMMRHHMMVLDMLQRQQATLMYRLALSAKSLQSAKEDVQQNHYLERIYLQTRRGDVQHLDFVKHETVELYDEAIQVIYHLTDLAALMYGRDQSTNQKTITNRMLSQLTGVDSMVDENAPRPTVAPDNAEVAKMAKFVSEMFEGYKADVRIGVALKYGEGSLANRSEQMLLRLCHLRHPIAILYPDVVNNGGAYVAGSFQWLPEVVQISIDQQVPIPGDMIEISSIVSFVASGTYAKPTVEHKMIFSCPAEAMAHIPPGTIVKTDLSAGSILPFYGSGYDNQFTFSVLPLAANGSLDSFLSDAKKYREQWKNFTSSFNSSRILSRVAFVPGNVRSIIDIKRNITTPIISNGRRPLSALEMLNCIMQATHGLRFLNSKAISHSDFKPLNVLVDDLRRAYVSDLGLSRAYGVPLHGVYGSPGFFPESLKEYGQGDTFSIVGPTLDCYALGVTIQQVLIEYGDVRFLQHVGTSFNDQELENYIASDPQSARGLMAPYVFYRPEDQETPVLQRPLSLNSAELYVRTMRYVASILMDNEYILQAVRSTRVSTMETRRHEHAISNRLLQTQIILTWLHDTLVASNQ